MLLEETRRKQTGNNSETSLLTQKIEALISIAIGAVKQTNGITSVQDTYLRTGALCTGCCITSLHRLKDQLEKFMEKNKSINPDIDPST